jgi:ClpP class serine protease
MPLLTQDELTPPEAVRDAARLGVQLHEAGKSGEPNPETIRRANSIAAGEPQSEEWATVEAPAWFARHEGDWEEGVDDVPGSESPGYVAWLLWGGDPGEEWVQGLQQAYLIRRARELDQGGDTGARVQPGVSAMAVEPSHVGALMSGAPRRHIEGALSVVHVEGPLYPMDYYGARMELRRAQLQGERTVVLHVDSPGGYVSGVRETRRAIARARDAGIYVVAYVSGMAASAALWVAAAADEIVASPLAQLGSVGVITTLYRDAEQGQTVEVVSSQTPKKRASVDDADYIAGLQRRVDEMAGVMLAEIAADRGTTVEALGDGSVYGAAEAVSRGLADRIASESDDWMFLGGSMPLDYARRVRTVTASASTSDGDMEALDMSEERKALDAQVEALTTELNAVRAQLEAAATSAATATAELQKRDAERMVETHVSAGRIPQARRGEWVERAVRLGVEEVGAMLSDLSPIVAVASPVGHGGAAADVETVKMNPREAEVARANDMLARFRGLKQGA